MASCALSASASTRSSTPQTDSGASAGPRRRGRARASSGRSGRSRSAMAYSVAGGSFTGSTSILPPLLRRGGTCMAVRLSTRLPHFRVSAPSADTARERVPCGHHGASETPCFDAGQPSLSRTSSMRRPAPARERATNEGEHDRCHRDRHKRSSKSSGHKRAGHRQRPCSSTHPSNGQTTPPASTPVVLTG